MDFLDQTKEIEPEYQFLRQEWSDPVQFPSDSYLIGSPPRLEILHVVRPI